MWRDLSAEQLGMLRNPQTHKGSSPRSLLAKLTGIQDTKEPKEAILLDFYVHILQFGQVAHTFVSVWRVWRVLQIDMKHSKF